ncbi:Squalene epoxidase [Entophlyctis sp. JEL0112]|nr:Squalene epoxidase [Entophlyctis sp. JEL0112]
MRRRPRPRLRRPQGAANWYAVSALLLLPLRFLSDICTPPPNFIFRPERDWKEPDRIVGELLQPGGVKALENLGLESKAIKLPPSSCTRTDQLIEFWTNQVYAPLTVVCDGCFSKFRKEVNNKPVKVSSTFVGLILKDCKLPNPNHGHVVLAQPSPVLLYQIGTHDTRALVDIPGAKIPSVSSGALATYMREKVCPQLPESVRPSFLAAVETNDMRSMPNSHLVPAQNTRRGVVLLGDANNMRHPLTGGGMTVAFWDVVHLRDVLRGADLDEFDDVRRRVKQVHWKRKEISATVNILANALYALFAAGSDPYAKVLQDGCVGYFKLGGICVSTPIGLLSGMLTNPLALIVHFFAVAIYGMLLLFASRPVYELPLTVVRAVGAMVVACFIVLPLIMNELQPPESSSSGRQAAAKPPQGASAKQISRRDEDYTYRLAKETRGKNLDAHDKEDGFLVDSDGDEEDVDGNDDGDDDDEEEEDDEDEDDSGADGRKKRKKSGSTSTSSSTKKPKKDKKRDEKRKPTDKSRRDDDDSDAELDTSLIISSSGRSTRGRKIDFTQFGMDRPEDDE